MKKNEWTLYEQVAVAAMDCQRLDVAKLLEIPTLDNLQEYIKVLQGKFRESKRVGRLEAMLLEAKGLWAEAEKAYSSLLEENQLDQVIHKRRVAMAKAQGNFSGAIDWLNKYLEIFMADHDAWRELAEIYVSLQMYKQAAFCYEELLLAQPTIPLYHLSYADVLYTLGGVENLHAAKKCYAATIDLTGGKNTRAFFGICSRMTKNYSFLKELARATGLDMEQVTSWFNRKRARKRAKVSILKLKRVNAELGQLLQQCREREAELLKELEEGRVREAELVDENLRLKRPTVGPVMDFAHGYP
ncbi:hypothetical protein OROHE_005619 [Orobanche hederae]